MDERKSASVEIKECLDQVKRVISQSTLFATLDSFVFVDVRCLHVLNLAILYYPPLSQIPDQVAEVKYGSAASCPSCFPCSIKPAFEHVPDFFVILQIPPVCTHLPL